MIWDRISESLQNKGFTQTTKDKRLAEFLIKVTDDRKMYICSIIKNIGGANISADVIVESAEQLERKFFLGGYNDVSVMHIIITDHEEEVSVLEQNGMQFWIVDVHTQKFMIFENQTENYFGIKEVIEDALKREQNIPQVRKIRDYLYFNKVPYITVAMLVINILVFIASNMWGDTNDLGFMLSIGALNADLVYENHEYLRLLISMFLHFDFLHLANNMFMLIIIGSRVERWMEHSRFFLVYMMSGIGGGIASIIYHTMNAEAIVGAGASGAIYGIMGALIVMMFLHQEEEVDLRHIFAVIVLIVVGSIESNFDLASHLGGFIMGGVSAFILCPEKREIEEFEIKD